jgi:hypothetical protein
VTILAEKDFNRVMSFVAVVLVFKSRVITMNGGDVKSLPPLFSNWLDGLLNDAAQQLPVSTMDTITDGLKKALLLSKPVGEQVCSHIPGPPCKLLLGVSNLVLVQLLYFVFSSPIIVQTTIVFGELNALFRKQFETHLPHLLAPKPVPKGALKSTPREL